MAPRKVDIRLPEKGIQTPMAQGRSTIIISMIKWIRTSRLLIKNSLSLKNGSILREVWLQTCTTASERRGDNRKGVKDFYLKVETRIWP